jgi:hypothetical protein
VSDRPAGAWEVGDRIAVVLAIVSAIAGGIFAFLGHYHVLHLDQDKEDLIGLVAGLALGGLIAVVWAVRILFDTFRRDRGNAGNILLGVGVIMLLAALGGGLAI